MHAKGNGTISALLCGIMFSLCVHQCFGCSEVRWESYWHFTQTTVKNLVLTTFMCVVEYFCVCECLCQANQCFFFPTNTLVPLSTPLTLHCLSLLILLRQKAFISVLPILTSQTAS